MEQFENSEGNQRNRIRNNSINRARNNSVNRSRNNSFNNKTQSRPGSWVSFREPSRVSPHMPLQEEDEMEDIDVYSIVSKEMTVKDRQETLNEIHPFGIRLWKAALYKKERGIDRVTEEAIKADPEGVNSKLMSFGNIMWTLLFGWWMVIVYVCCALILLVFGFKKYSALLVNIAGYLFWPFGKYIEKDSPRETRALLEDDDTNTTSENWDARSTYAYQDVQFIPFVTEGVKQFKISGLAYYLIFFLILYPMHLLVSAVCWFSVMAVPMARANMVLARHLFYFPLQITAKPIGRSPAGETVLCTKQAMGFQYYKYTYDGVNIILLNLLVFVFFALFDGYFIAPHYTPEAGPAIGAPIAVFIFSILSIIPLAYYIGMAVSSIGAQSSLGMAAVINATFGSIVEIILYCLALMQKKSKLVEGAIVGSFLGTMLLLPGVSMIAGGIKRKQQRFNIRSTGVTSTMLIFSMIGAFTPTLFNYIYGKVDIHCSNCVGSECQACTLIPIQNDDFFNNSLKPLMFVCAAILPTAYLIGLWFTLRTHVAQIYDSKRLSNFTESHRYSSEDLKVDATFAVPDQEIHDVEHSEAGNGHDAPNWSKTKSVMILLGSTLLFSLLAEVLVDSTDKVLEQVHIDERFLGVTLFALAPNVTEFLNAIAFAINGNISLSLEIGSAYSVQVALLQIPALVFFSAYYNSGAAFDVSKNFFLLFPFWDVITVILSVFLLTYTFNEGKSNYFKGSILTFAYIVLITSDTLPLLIELEENIAASLEYYVSRLGLLYSSLIDEVVVFNDVADDSVVSMIQSQPIFKSKDVSSLYYLEGQGTFNNRRQLPLEILTLRVSDYLSILNIYSSNEFAHIQQWINSLGRKAIFYGLGPKSELLIKNMQSSDHKDKELDPLTPVVQGDNLLEQMNQSTIKNGIPYEDLRIPFSFEDLPVDLLLKSTQRDGLVKLRKDLIDFIQSIDKEKTVKIPRILGMPSANQFNRFLSDISNLQSMADLINSRNKPVINSLAAVNTLTENERQLRDDLLGIEKVLLATVNENPSSNLIPVLIELIETERKAIQKHFEFSHFLCLAVIVYSIQRIEHVDESLLEAFESLNSAEYPKAQQLLVKLCELNRLRSKFTVFSGLTTKSPIAYQPLLSQIVENILRPRGDLSDLLYIDNRISSYISSILKAGSHPALNSDHIIVFVLGGITPFEMKCALDTIQKEGNPSELQISFVSDKLINRSEMLNMLIKA